MIQKRMRERKVEREREKEIGSCDAVFEC